MKLVLFIISLLFGFYSATAQYAEHKLIVKFKAGEQELYHWLANQRSGEIKAFSQILGRHNTSPFVSKALLKMMHSKKHNDKMLSSSACPNELSFIAVIEYTAGIAPPLLARKLASFPFIEYAEPLPVHKIFTEPNDPKRNRQYYLKKVHTFEAWDIVDKTKTIIAAIVDTGIDYEHEDLKDNIYINPGEDGIDKNGKSRRNNGIDDDANGFIDDWRGWDFASDTGKSKQDNVPKPGHRHGTHVGGTVGAVTNNYLGIASVGRFVKLLPVKTGPDSQFAISITNGYDGLLYAGIAGADVINCSWGSGTRSQAEKELVDSVLKLGSVIVAAAGNNGNHETFYPAGYDGIISVAALNSADRKAFFSNYDETVDVSAPGKDILATVPNNSYDFMSGTSMAAPVVTGVAALARMAHPALSPRQIRELLRVTCDNIDTSTKNYRDLLGKGRVNALKAVSANNPHSVRMIHYTVEDENKDGILDIGEKVNVYIQFKNILSDIYNVSVKVFADSYYPIQFSNDSIYIGNMKSGDTAKPKKPISFIVPGEISYDYEFKIKFRIQNKSGIINTESITLFSNPSYRNLDSNNISLTLNSRGNIGFNDYPKNLQGLGLKYKGSQNINFEGGLIIGSGYERISDCVRGRRQSNQDRDFLSRDFLSLQSPGNKAKLEASVTFADAKSPNQAGVSVYQQAYQFTDKDAMDIIFISYDIVNTSFFLRDSVFAGLFFDWDIGPGGTNNQVIYDRALDFGYAQNIKDKTLPLVGAKIVTLQRTNFYGIDNGGNIKDTSISIYNGYSKEEKWLTISNGIKRPKTSVSDVSMVISAGPVRMLPYDTVRITFALFAANSLTQLKENARNAQQIANRYGLSSSNYSQVPARNTITKVYPNPSVRGKVNVDYTIVSAGTVFFEIYDLKGMKVNLNTLPKERTEGRYRTKIDTQLLSSGVYLLVMKSADGISSSFIYIEN